MGLWWKAGLLQHRLAFTAGGELRQPPGSHYHFTSLRHPIPVQSQVMIRHMAQHHLHKLTPVHEGNGDRGNCLGDAQGLTTKLHTRKTPTIIVNPAIIVFIPISHQFFNVILGDGLSRCLKHDLQLFKVDVAIGISVQGQKISEADQHAGEEELGQLHCSHHPTVLRSAPLLIKHPEEI